MTGNVTYGKGKAVHATVGNRGNASLCGAWKIAEANGAEKHDTDSDATCKSCLKAREAGRQDDATLPVAEVVEITETECPTCDVVISGAVCHVCNQVVAIEQAHAEAKAEYTQRLAGEFAVWQETDEVHGPVDKAAILAKPIDPLMNSGAREATGSAVVKLLEKVWARIREDHPDLPEVVIVTGSGLVGASKWGHFRANGWTSRSSEHQETINRIESGGVSRMHELFMAGETLAKGSRQVVQTMLHEGAHTLARVRDIKDTSRQGRWHNKAFQKLAEEMGLEHRGTVADKSHGYSFVTLTAATIDRYADLLAELDREIHLMCDLPGYLGGSSDEDDKGGEKIGTKPRDGETKTSGNLKATCACDEPVIIRVSRKVLDLGVVKCEACDELFRASE